MPGLSPFLPYKNWDFHLIIALFAPLTLIFFVFQTWVLKVSIHCQGCKRKVKKVLRGIDGIQQNRINPLLLFIIVCCSCQLKIAIERHQGSVETFWLITCLNFVGEK